MNGKSIIGAIWFVNWIKGYKQGDLEIFCEALFKYLSMIYSKKYKIDPKYCMIVDAVSKDIMIYNQILENKIPSLLNATVDALSKYL